MELPVATVFLPVSVFPARLAEWIAVSVLSVDTSVVLTVAVMVLLVVCETLPDFAGSTADNFV